MMSWYYMNIRISIRFPNRPVLLQLSPFSIFLHVTLLGALTPFLNSSMLYIFVPYQLVNIRRFLDRLLKNWKLSRDLGCNAILFEAFLYPSGDRFRYWLRCTSIITQNIESDSKYNKHKHVQIAMFLRNSGQLWLTPICQSFISPW
jgi:hypothetical protein